MLKKDKNKVHKPKNTIVGGVKDSIDTNIEKLVNKCNVLDSIYKFDLNSISSKEKIDEIYTSFTTTDGTLQINKIKKILLCLRFGTEDFYNLLETDSELQDVDDKNLADTICDNFEIELNNKIGLINTKYVIPFSLIYYNNGIIYVDKYVDDTDRLPKYTLLIDDSYSTKGTEGIKIGGYLKYEGENIYEILADLKKNDLNKDSIIFFRENGVKILNIEKVIGRLIIDFVKTIKADEKVFTDYKDWISGEIIKYYVIYFIKIFINNYNKKDIQKKTLVTLLKNLRLATIGNYRELKEFRDIINSVVNETDEQLKNISSEIDDKWAFAVSTNRVSHKCDESDNITGLQNIMFFSFMFKNELNIDINILSKLKHITKTWHRNRGVFWADIKKENCDNIIEQIIKDKTFYTKGFETYIQDLEYKIEKQKEETIPTKIEIYNSFLKTINNLKTNIPEKIESIKVSSDKFLGKYQEHDNIKFENIEALKKYNKQNELEPYNNIFSKK
jgi:hypothetical protein